MALKGLVSKKNTYVDPLEEAANLATGATNLFTEAYDQLEQSNGILRDEALAAVDAQVRAKERQVQAEAQLENNSKVQSKLEDFLPRDFTPTVV